MDPVNKPTQTSAPSGNSFKPTSDGKIESSGPVPRQMIFKVVESARRRVDEANRSGDPVRVKDAIDAYEELAADNTDFFNELRVGSDAMAQTGTAMFEQSRARVLRLLPENLVESTNEEMDAHTARTGAPRRINTVAELKNPDSLMNAQFVQQMPQSVARTDLSISQGRGADAGAIYERNLWMAVTDGITDKQKWKNSWGTVSANVSTIASLMKSKGLGSAGEPKTGTPTGLNDEPRAVPVSEVALMAKAMSVAGNGSITAGGEFAAKAAGALPSSLGMSASERLTETARVTKTFGFLNNTIGPSGVASFQEMAADPGIVRDRAGWDKLVDTFESAAKGYNAGLAELISKVPGTPGADQVFNSQDLKDYTLAKNLLMSGLASDTSLVVSRGQEAAGRLAGYIDAAKMENKLTAGGWATPGADIGSGIKAVQLVLEARLKDAPESTQHEALVAYFERRGSNIPGADLVEQYNNLMKASDTPMNLAGEASVSEEELALTKQVFGESATGPVVTADIMGMKDRVHTLAQSMLAELPSPLNPFNSLTDEVTLKNGQTIQAKDAWKSVYVLDAIKDELDKADASHGVTQVFRGGINVPSNMNNVFSAEGIKDHKAAEDAREFVRKQLWPDGKRGILNTATERLAFNRKVVALVADNRPYAQGSSGKVLDQVDTWRPHRTGSTTDPQANATLMAIKESPMRTPSKTAQQLSDMSLISSEFRQFAAKRQIPLEGDVSLGSAPVQTSPAGTSGMTPEEIASAESVGVK